MAANAETTITDRLLNGSDINVFYNFQATKGAVNTSPVWIPYRRGDGMPVRAISYTDGADIPQDRQAVEQLKESEENTAELNGGFHKQAVSLLIAALAGGDETQLTDTDTTYAATSTGFTDTGGNFASYNVGDAIFVSGFSDSTIDRVYVITAKADSNTITTSPAPAATEAAGESVTMSVNRSYSGETETLISMQTRIPDTTKTSDTDYFTTLDGYINTFSMEIPDTGIITSTMNVLFGGYVTGSAAISGQTDAALQTDDELTATSNVDKFYVNNTEQDCKIKSITLELNNNYQADDGAGCSKEYAIGQLQATGSVVVRSPISAPLVWRDYYRNGTDVGTIGVRLSHDSSGTDQTIIMIENCKITEHSMPSASNTVANSEASFTAQRNNTLATTVKVYRNWV